MADLQQAGLKVTVGTHLRVTASTYVCWSDLQKFPGKDQGKEEVSEGEERATEAAKNFHGERGASRRGNDRQS